MKVRITSRPSGGTTLFANSCSVMRNMKGDIGQKTMEIGTQTRRRQMQDSMCSAAPQAATRPSPNTVRQEDCYEDLSSDTAWVNPMPYEGQSSSSSSWRPRVREDAANSTHGTWRPGVCLTPMPKPQRDPTIDFQPPSDEGKDMKGHSIRNMCSTCGTNKNKDGTFFSE